MKKIQKRDLQKGAISVFLVIILIPCIVISSTFVDLSRVMLSQGVATSAADMAMNSLMANYDKDLNEFYGLMASCQNIDEFYAEAAQCFMDALYSQGLNADDAESLLAYVNTMLMDEEVHDLLQMEVQTETENIISNVKDASLGTSEVIVKDQIVEFMKYRAPVEITSNIIDRLSKAGAEGVFGDAKKDEPLVEKKEQYAKAEEDFMDAALKTYKALKKFESYKLQNKNIETMLQDMKDARETYREITGLIVSNFHGTEGLKQFSRPTYPLNQYSYTEKSTKVHSRKVKDESGNYVYYIDGKKITSLLNGLENSITTFKNKRKAVTDAVGNTLVDASIGTTGSNQYHPIQWWAAVYPKVKTPIANFESAAKSMLEAYSKVLAIKKCTLGDNIPADWETRFDQLTQSVTDLQKDYLTANVKEGTTNNRYLRLVNKLEKHSKDNINKISPDKVKLKNGKTVTAAITDVQTKLSNHYTKLDDAIKALDTLIDGALINNPYSLAELANKAETYKTSYNGWKGMANGSTTTMGQNDREDIAAIEKEGKVLAIGRSDIMDLRSRLVSVRDRLKEVKSTLESMKFGSKKLKDISKLSTAYNAVKSGITDNLTNSQVNNNASALFKAKFTPYTSDKNAAVKTFDFNKVECDPNLKNSPPSAYTWLHSKFDNAEDDDIENGKKQKEGKKNEGENKQKEAKEKDRSGTVSKINLYGNSGTYAPADFPSGLDAQLPYKLGDSIITSLASTVSDLTKGNFDGIRDALYSTEYVMDMFSYHTYENEGRYELYKKSHNDDAPKSKSDLTTEEINKAWQSVELPDKYNKTLTNQMINAEQNVLYGCEVEYILYGKSNKSNITSAYADIFAIRYPLNTLSAFQNFWTSTKNTTAGVIEAVAAGISSATAGVVPVPAIKCVAILLLAACETAKDLDHMSDGFPVVLYKATDEDWFFTLNYSFSAEEKEDVATKGGLFYSDYIYLFTLLGFKGKSASEMYRRTADVIQANMRKYTGTNTYVLKNAKSYFKLEAKIRVKPLMLALPMASDGYSNNPKDATDWCTFDISEIRGYS